MQSTTLRVALFSEYHQPYVSGTVIAVETQKKGLSALNHRFLHFTTSPTPTIQSDTIYLPSIKFPLSLGYTTPITTLYGSWFKQLIRFSPDIIHIQHPFVSGLLGIAASKRLNVPVVFTYHTFLHHYAHYVPIPSTITIRILNFITRWFANHCDRVIAPSQVANDYLLSHHVLTPVDTIPTGIDITQFSPGNAEEIRTRYDIGQNDPVFITCGRLVKEKNLTVLINIFKTIYDLYPTSKLMVIGDGPERNHLNELCVTKGISASVKFVGEVEHHQLHKYYSAADGFLFTSLSETQGIVVLEALACGLPVLCLKECEAARTYVKDGINGFVCEIDQFASSIDYLITHPVFLQEMRKAARDSAIPYSTLACAQQLLQVYQDVILTHSPRRLPE